ncbi:MAG TPA: DUF4388 domain-containing protein, partial [Byssovorax sp.]
MPWAESARLIKQMITLEADRSSGTLVVVDGEPSTRVYFRLGQAIFADDGTPRATLGRSLLERGRITATQLGDIEERVARAPVACEQMRVGEALIELGL